MDEHPKSNPPEQHEKGKKQPRTQYPQGDNRQRDRQNQQHRYTTDKNKQQNPKNERNNNNNPPPPLSDGEEETMLSIREQESLTPLLPDEQEKHKNTTQKQTSEKEEEPAKHRPIIGITIGDMNSIAIEVIIKTFQDSRMLEHCTPVIYGSSRAMSYHRKVLQFDAFNYHIAHNITKIKHGICNIINCWTDEVPITIGKPNKKMGDYAFQALEAATFDLQNKHLEAIVTAPINKHHVHNESNGFMGHTEYLTQKFNAPNSVMLLVSNILKVGLATNHLPIKDVAENISTDLLIKKMTIMTQTLLVDFGIMAPKIAVLSLNPHAGDDGLIGSEDDLILKPAIEKVNQQQHSHVFGPFAADGFFGSGMYSRFDAILAMYHDQGLIPFKALSFGHGVNYTAGLPIVRTSPDHGTAYDIAGKNIASEESFRSAVFMALDIARNRYNYAEMNENPLQRGLAAKAGLVTREGTVA